MNNYINSINFHIWLAAKSSWELVGCVSALVVSLSLSSNCCTRIYYINSTLQNFLGIGKVFKSLF